MVGIASSSRRGARHWMGWQFPAQSFLASRLLPLAPRREDDAIFSAQLSDHLHPRGLDSNTSHRRADRGLNRNSTREWILKIRKPAYWDILDTKEIFGASEQVLLKALNCAHHQNIYDQHAHKPTSMLLPEPQTRRAQGLLGAALVFPIPPLPTPKVPGLLLCWKLICLVSFVAGWEGTAGTGFDRVGAEVFAGHDLGGGGLEVAVKPANTTGEAAEATC